jgi:hypothetical protein
MATKKLTAPKERSLLESSSPKTLDCFQAYPPKIAIENACEAVFKLCCHPTFG